MMADDDNVEVEVDSVTINSLLGPSVSSQHWVPGPGTGAKVQGGAAPKAPRQQRPNKRQRAKCKFWSVSVAGGPSTQAGTNPAPTRSSSHAHPGRVSGWHGRSGPQVSVPNQGWQGSGRSHVPTVVKPPQVFNRHVPGQMAGRVSCPHLVLAICLSTAMSLVNFLVAKLNHLVLATNLSTAKFLVNCLVAKFNHQLVNLAVVTPIILLVILTFQTFLVQTCLF